MNVLIAVLMTVFLSLGTANVFANCGTCDKAEVKDKVEGKGDAKGSCKNGCKGRCKDGKVPAEILKKFDKDGDGKLNDDEKAACKAAHETKKAEFEKKMLEKFDTDKDGKLSDDEKAAMKKAMEEHKAKRGKGCKKGEGSTEKKAEDKSV